MIEWPFISRARFDVAQQQIADLKEANGKLWDLVALKQNSPSDAKEDENVEPARPHRKLGAQLRSEFRAAAEERADQLRAERGKK